MGENIKERLEDIEDLDKMLDTVFDSKKDTIASGKEEIIDAIKHDGISFDITENGKEFTVTKNIYEVIVSKDGKTFHEIYDDQGNMLMPPISDESFINMKNLLETSNGEIDNKLLESVMKDESGKSLSELENENNKEIADALGMNEDDIKSLQIHSLISNEKDGKDKNTKNNPALESEVNALKNMGYTIDTTELATDEETIKEFLGTDANNLLVVKINSDWKIFKVGSDGSLELENNLEISANESAFHTVNEQGHKESRMAEIEFKRKDHPDYSIAIDSQNKENTTQIYLVAGNSRTATEIENKTVKQPYAEQINNERLKRAQENPDDEKNPEQEADPHEPTLEPGSNNHY